MLNWIKNKLRVMLRGWLWKPGDIVYHHERTYVLTKYKPDSVLGHPVPLGIVESVNEDGSVTVAVMGHYEVGVDVAEEVNNV